MKVLVSGEKLLSGLKEFGYQACSDCIDDCLDCINLHCFNCVNCPLNSCPRVQPI